MNPPSEWHYVAAAYGVVFVAVLVWVAIIGAKLQRLQRQIGELVEQERNKKPSRRLDGGSQRAEAPALPAPEREIG
jgi:CcmD family protein